MKIVRALIALSCLAVLAWPAQHAQAANPLAMKKGSGGSEVTGSAGPSGSQGESGDQQTCPKPMGAIAVVEPQDFVVQSLSRYGMQSPTSLIRMMIQQSNCFIVVERGVGMQNMMQERALAGSGELRQGSNVGRGQMVSADFILTPNVVFSEDNAGGVGGALGGLFGGRGGAVLGAIASGLKFKEAQTSMLIADARSGVQVASATGSARKADLRLGGLLFGGGAGAALGGYQNTNEGKVIASSLLDNFNQVVLAVRNNPSLQRDVGTLAQEAGRKTKAGAVYNEGDVLHPKIASVKLLAQGRDGAKVVRALSRNDELIFSGAEQGGYLEVETNYGKGWVKKILITR